MILHIATCNKFTEPFFAFVKKHLGLSGHVVLSRTRKNDWPEELHLSSHHGMWLVWMVSFFYLAWKAEKIILHNLNDPRIVILLFLQPWALKKCYWIIWGGELYAYRDEKRNCKWRLKELFRRPVFKHIGHLVSYVEGDIKLAREWYGATGEYHECLAYTSNLYQNHEVVRKPHDTINIMVGNSGDPSNGHLEILEKLQAFRDRKIMIFAPLSYNGCDEYIKCVVDTGKKLFNEKFKPVTEFMPFKQYLEFLETIDIAIFNHDRQQAMGNTVALLGLGKKVYMRNDVTHRQVFDRIGIHIFRFTEFNLDLLDYKTSKQNQLVIKKYFSRRNLITQLRDIFETTQSAINKPAGK